MKRIVFFLLFAVLSGSMPLGPAMADRHCAPVLDYYYLSRFAVRQDGVSCEEAVQHGLENLSEAADQAWACGCLSLQTSLTEFVADLQNGEMSCSARQTAILDLAKGLSQRVDACQ